MGLANRGWQTLLAGFPWFVGEGRFPLPAYSEFMPPPRLGRSPFGSVDPLLFSEDDPYGWRVSEKEEEHEFKPGLERIAKQIMGALVKLGRGLPERRITGYKGNLQNNPYWPPALAEQAGHLDHERYVVFLPLALAKTQDSKGRVTWTFFGGSEQGPERAFWQSFYSALGQELPEQEAVSFVLRLLAAAYGETAKDAAGLRRIGFRVLPSEKNERFPYWNVDPLPSWTKPYLMAEDAPVDNVRYLLTFRPFSRLPEAVQKQYLAGKLHLLPFPGSLVFWGMPTYLHLQEQLAMAMQLPLSRLVGRFSPPGGIRVPESGWLNEPKQGRGTTEMNQEYVSTTYRRKHRWDRAERYEAESTAVTHEDRVSQVLFSTAPDSLRLYDKPMARNARIWTEDFDLLLDGPSATPEQIQKASAVVDEGGVFAFRFHFPAMRVGPYEVYWQRPLVTYLSSASGEPELLPDAPLGYLTAYKVDSPDLAHPVELWPRLLQRKTYLAALQHFDNARDYYVHQTPMNIVRLLDTWQVWGKRPLPRSFARQLLRLPEHESLQEWLDSLPERADDPAIGQQVREELERLLEPSKGKEPRSGLVVGMKTEDLPTPITYGETATRAYEEAFWIEMYTLAHGQFVTKDNADTVVDPVTLGRLPHHDRDLEHLGDYLLNRHRQAIAEAGMDGKAVCGEIPFHWRTDFDYSVYGGWKKNQEGHAYERNLLVVIPGKNRSEAVILADHYDTAYMEDLYEVARGGSGIRVAAAGADDNHSATATLLLAAPVYLKLAKEGRLERDVWLLHLTGEEFPSDCLGARHICHSLVEKTLKMRRNDGKDVDLSGVRIVGVFVMDMIAHDKDSDRDVFQISPGTSPESLRLAWQAHLANAIWNAHAGKWNQKPERGGRGRGKRSPDFRLIPEIALHPHLQGEVRTPDNPHSTLFNTDAMIFSDIGAPVVLFMENYDINRSGYHDTKDTMENIDLDYGAAVSAIAIETVARVATQE